MASRVRRVLCSGSRDWANVDIVVEVLSQFNPDTTTIIHGAANGLDTIADKVAKALGMEVEDYPADWDRYGYSAGPRRNIEMLNKGIDLVIAFRTKPNSKGTNHCILEAKKRNIRTIIIDGWEYE